MELNKERGPIYSRYDRDKSDNYKTVIDYAAPPRTSEEIEFMLAHKITPTEAEPGDMQPRAGQRYQQGTAPLPAFLQSLSDSMTQRTSNQAGGLQDPASATDSLGVSEPEYTQESRHRARLPWSASSSGSCSCSFRC